MIEINLAPGSAKRQKKRTLPKVATGGGAPKLKAPSMDRSRLYVVAAWIVGLGLVALLQFTSAGRLGQLETDVQAARADSTRLHALRVLNDSLLAQRDTIAAKLQVIQDIDAGRFIWAHLFDEIGRAVPAYTWLVNLTDASSDGPLPRFKIEGRTGNTFALARFMQNLEASAFIRGVTLTQQTQTVENQRTVYSFVLEGSYEEPPPEAIQTQPLFSVEGDLAVDTLAAAAGIGQED